MNFISPPLGSEAADVAALQLGLTPTTRQFALEIGRALVTGARQRADERPYLDAFLQEFGLSNQEGIALMCLAEALLRIPDAEMADRLIAEKLASGNWETHAGRSSSTFVNASTWGLMLTGRLVELPEEIRRDANGWFKGLAQRASEPIVRQALRRAMQIIGGEFVVGRNIDEALRRSANDSRLALCSFDMLGEGARTDRDALRYLDAYKVAIESIGRAMTRRRDHSHDLHGLSSISIKLSALDPRYSLLQHERTISNLLPRALELTRLAARTGIALTIDAEEQDRLELSLELFAALMHDPETRDWPGLGLAIQAYGRRAPAVIDHVTTLAKDLRRSISIRLVKGAYWDSEIKRAQERGLAEYPVYTRKCSTDVAYLACAQRLIAAAPLVYPQFATHNAHTIGAILAAWRERHGAERGAETGFEYQRLHGMGVLLFDEAQRQLPAFPRVRVYAPVGPHADLLAYLVRRLLENGANTSFVNRFMDEAVPVDHVVSDPLDELTALPSIAHPAIPLPQQLFGSERGNSRGLDFGRQTQLAELRANLQPPPHIDAKAHWQAASVVPLAFDTASQSFIDWSEQPVEQRAAIIERAAEQLEAQCQRFIALLVHEAGKTVADALAEVREAADFCRYYAAEARKLQAQPGTLAGPTGERNELHYVPRGVWACISPWNFPLAIFTGQVVAALVTGNTVVAKPAETTPQVALAMTGILHEAGIPREALQVVPMPGREFGELALRHAALAGVVFTGSTATARWLNRALAEREGAILPLIAETGGINAMLVDSTALPEQVVDDAIASAFGSAGQRCSALRLLCLQDDSADRIIEMLIGAMETLVIGDPASLNTDVGPVITAEAARALESHIAEMSQTGRVLKRLALPANLPCPARFVAPALIEITAVSALRQEAFGPILHVLRYRSSELTQLLTDIRANGYGLTLGIQTRLDSTRDTAFAGSRAGNVYVNRNMIGAVVGVQPFGGTALSGTGPKAGGPQYLHRFTTERTLTINTTATGGNTALLSLD